MDPVQVPVRSGTVVSDVAVVEHPATTMTINNAKRNTKKPFMVYTCLLPEIIKYRKKSKKQDFFVRVKKQVFIFCRTFRLIPVIRFPRKK